MTPETSRTWWNLLTGVLFLMTAAQAIHWLMTSSSASASNARWWAVVAQAFIGTVLAAWLLWRARSLRRHE